MRLTELDPRWLETEGRKVGITFICPCCRSPETRLTAFFEPTPFRRQVELMLPISGKERGDRIDWIPSKADFAWARTGETFDSLSITPSIDASKARHWHGHVTNGEIR